MAGWLIALSVAVEEDLLPLSVLLRQRGVPHRVIEEDGQQVLQVTVPEHAEAVRELYRAWRAGEVQLELSERGGGTPLRQSIDWLSAPVTVLMALASVATFALFYLFPAPVSWMALFTYVPFEVVEGRPVFLDGQGQYWRLVTPIFLHFGWLHIVFNCLWLWELGSRVERVLGHMNLFLLILVIAAVSNSAQYLTTGPALFGGMSGVVYGLLGFAWVAPLVQPAWRIQPAPAIMLFMVGWLVICLVGVVEVLGFGRIANAAHLGGLVCGALLGAIFGLASRSAGSPAQR